MDTQLEKEQVNIPVRELGHVLKQNIVVILLCSILGASVSGILTKTLITPQYSASSMIYILTKTTSVTSLADIQMGAQLTTDFATLAKSRPVVEQVIQKLSINLDYEEMTEKIHVGNPADTRILKITVSDPDPERAAKISNAMAEATADQVADIMSTDRPSIVENAVVPQKISSPDFGKNVAIGGIVGLLLAITLVLAFYMMDDTVKTEEDVRQHIHLHVLAAFPLERESFTEQRRLSKK